MWRASANAHRRSREVVPAHDGKQLRGRHHETKDSKSPDIARQNSRNINTRQNAQQHHRRKNHDINPAPQRRRQVVPESRRRLHQCGLTVSPGRIIESVMCCPRRVVRICSISTRLLMNGCAIDRRARSPGRRPAFAISGSTAVTICPFRAKGSARDSSRVRRYADRNNRVRNLIENRNRKERTEKNVTPDLGLHSRKFMIAPETFIVVRRPMVDATLRDRPKCDITTPT